MARWCRLEVAPPFTVRTSNYTRPIAELATLEDVAGWLERVARGAGLVLAATALVPKLRSSVTSEVLDGCPDPDDAITLVRVRRTFGW